jgi:hypothetical protein
MWNRESRGGVTTHPDIPEDDLGELVDRVREATGALMQGDVRRYAALVNHAPDFTLVPPTGGPPRQGFDSSAASIDALEETFPGGGDGDLDDAQGDLSTANESLSLAG